MPALGNVVVSIGNLIVSITSHASGFAIGGARNSLDATANHAALLPSDG